MVGFKLLVAAALATLGLVGCAPKPGGGPGSGMGAAPEVGIVIAEAKPVDLTADLTGRTSAFLVSEVRPQVGGVVQFRLFQEGSSVRAGQPLYQIDPATYRAAFQSAQANVAQAQATLTSARLKAGRYKELVAINAVSRQDDEDAQAAFQQAEANVAAQKAAAEQARINLGYTRVLAPISGRIGKSSVTPGALVTASQTTPLATIQEMDRIYVDVTQSASDLLKLEQALSQGAIGRPSSAEVRLILDDGSTYEIPGRLEFSDVTVDAGTDTVTLRAVFPNSRGVLLPGLFVRARLSKGVAAQGILIPQAAVSRDARGQATVFVVGAGDKAEPRVLILSQTIGDKWLVASGLKPGDRVIVEGLQKVQPGVAVKPSIIGARS